MFRYCVARNPVVQSNKIDVHGLRPREAFDRIERAVVKANQEKRSQVLVIVGKGLHSVNQQPTLKPAVMREMQRYVSPDVHRDKF
jgi:DNA-nicking Smr family endonuclease